MMSLRERQKQKRREDMLAAARTLFVERGYSRSTMEAIAERAEVGVATVYTYFANKEGVFAELARMDMSELKAEGEAVLEDLPADPAAAEQALSSIADAVCFLASDMSSHCTGIDLPVDGGASAGRFIEGFNRL